MIDRDLVVSPNNRATVAQLVDRWLCIREFQAYPELYTMHTSPRGCIPPRLIQLKLSILLVVGFTKEIVELDVLGSTFSNAIFSQLKFGTSPIEILSNISRLFPGSLRMKFLFRP